MFRLNNKKWIAEKVENEHFQLRVELISLCERRQKKYCAFSFQLWKGLFHVPTKKLKLFLFTNWLLARDNCYHSSHNGCSGKQNEKKVFSLLPFVVSSLFDFKWNKKRNETMETSEEFLCHERSYLRFIHDRYLWTLNTRAPAHCCSLKQWRNRDQWNVAK